MTTDVVNPSHWENGNGVDGADGAGDYDGGLSSAKVFERIRIKALSGECNGKSGGHFAV